MKDVYDLLGRIFISTIFLYEVLDTFFFYSNTKSTLTFYGITWGQDFILILGMIIMTIGGILVLIGYYANFGAFLLLLYCLPYTIIVFDFWNQPVEKQQLASLNFMRYLAICGGLLVLMANGSRKYSIRRLIHNLRLPE